MKKLSKQDNIILTGAKGFLGSVICEQLSNICTLNTIGRSEANDIRLDLINEIPRINNTKINSVIHVAGKAHIVPKTPDERASFWRINLDGTRNLCKGLEKSGCLPANFVFISTVSVYGLDEGYDINEAFPLCGTSDYARSKIEAEQWLIKWSKQHSVKLLIFRLPLVAGVNPPGNLGAMIRGIQNGRYFRIGNGAARKSMVMAEDVANIIANSLGKEGIYNLTDGQHPSFNELESIIASQLGKRPPYSLPYPMAKIAAKVGDLVGDKFPINSSRLSKLVSTLTFSDEKARRELGWSPARVIDAFRISKG